MITKIEFTCTQGHQQIITYTGMQREFAESVAKLTDGTSPLYKYPPGPESSIGKCGICNSQLKSRVLDDAPGNPDNGSQQTPPSTSH